MPKPPHSSPTVTPQIHRPSETAPHGPPHKSFSSPPRTTSAANTNPATTLPIISTSNFFPEKSGTLFLIPKVTSAHFLPLPPACSASSLGSSSKTSSSPAPKQSS